MKTNKSKKTKDDKDVIFKCERDDIVIYDKSNIWLYVLSKLSWDNFTDKITQKKMILGTRDRNTLVDKNDIILFFVKEPRKSGFFAIGEIDTQIIRNKTNEYIFNDDSANKYIVELSTISIFDEFYKMNKFKNLIPTALFTSKYTKKEYEFISFNGIGLDFIKNIYEKNEDLIEINNKIDDKIDDIINELNNDIICNTLEKNRNDYIIVNNIPIMIITCIDLRRKMKKIDQDRQRINIILEHYNCCSKCEIINNNNNDVNSTLRKIKTDDISFDLDSDDIDDIIEQYLQSEIKQVILDNLFVKIHYLSQENFYNNDVLIEYSSQIKRKYLAEEKINMYDQ